MTPILPPHGSGIELIWTSYLPEKGLHVAQTLEGWRRESAAGALEAAEALAHQLFPDGYHMRRIKGHDEVWLATASRNYTPERKAA